MENYNHLQDDEKEIAMLFDRFSKTTIAIISFVVGLLIGAFL